MTNDSLNQSTQKITLSVSTVELEKFCNKLLKRSRDISKTHEGLSTLEAFFTVFGKAEHGTSEYFAVEGILKSFSEITRQQLLDERTGQLSDALKEQDINKISSIYIPLSRSGFFSILETAVNRMTQEEIMTLTPWVLAWTNDAKRQAEQASGYPDALDFKKAGINIEEYQTMVDINHYLQNTV